MATDYSETTQGVRVSVRSFFLTDQSKPEEHRFVWAYRVRIENQGGVTVQLLRRTWLITDAAGRTKRVHGDGVIGQTPVLAPGEPSNTPPAPRSTRRAASWAASTT